MEVIRIEITGSPKDIEATITALEKIGKVDKQNADQFKKHHEEEKQRKTQEKDAIQKEIGLIEHLRAKLKQLEEAREKANDPKKIEKINKILSEQGHRLDKLTAVHKKHAHDLVDFNTKLTHSFKELGEGIIAAFAVERLIEFGVESVKKYAEAEEAAKKLEFAIVSVNGESQESFERLKKQADDLKTSLKNIYDDEDILGVQTQLANFGLSGKMIEGLTPTILDIAAATGKSLPEATEKAILAINGQTRGLRDIGVAFKDTGSKTANYNKLIEQTAKFSGAAEEKSHSLQGRLDAMKVMWGDLQENIGEFISRGFDVVEFLSQAIGGTDEWTGSLADLAKQVGLTTEQMEKMLASTGSTILSVQLANARAMGDGLAVQKLTQELLLQREKEYGERARNLKDEDLKKEIEKEEEFVKKVNESKLFEIIKAEDLTHKKKLEILEEALKARAKLENDDTLAGEDKKKAALERLLRLQEKYYADLEAIRKKDAEDFLRLNMELIEDETKKKLAAEEAAFEKEKQEFTDREKKLAEIIKNGRTDQRIAAKLELEKLFQDEELAEKSHLRKMAKIQEEADKKAKEEAMKAQIEKSATLSKNAEIENKRALVNGKKTQEAYNKQQKQIEIGRLEEELAIKKQFGIEDYKLQQEIEEKKLDLIEQSKEATKKLMDGLHRIYTDIFDSLEEHILASIAGIDTQMDHTNKMIDVQKALAQKGLQNELAFEEKRADELMKKKLKEQEKLKKVKEFETFLNSLARFSEDNPRTALAKALGVLAATKAAEAMFMEEGGIAGHAKVKTQVGLRGFARRHQGGDILAQLDPREGVIPADKMAQWGLHTPDQFKSFLRTPFHEKLITKATFVNNSNAALLKEIQDLKEVIKSRPVTTWDVDKLGNLIENQVKNGFRTLTNHKRSFL